MELCIFFIAPAADTDDSSSRRDSALIMCVVVDEEEPCIALQVPLGTWLSKWEDRNSDSSALFVQLPFPPTAVLSSSYKAVLL